MKVWAINQIYNFATEFNRVENELKYFADWLGTYYQAIIYTPTLKLDWAITDIPDIVALNRIKTNINVYLSAFSLETLVVSSAIDQVWNYIEANKLEVGLQNVLEIIGNWQFQTMSCGLAITGNNLRIVGE